MSLQLSEDQVLDRVRDILSNVLLIPADQIPPDATIMFDLNAESIDLLDLCFRIEKAFGFVCTNQDLAAACGPIRDAAEFRDRFTVRALARHLCARGVPCGD
jgi:acyl carrier protein